MLRRSKAISKKHDRPAPARGSCEVEMRGRCCLSPGSGFSPGCRGWGRGTRTETAGPGCAGVGRGRKKRDSFAGALLAQSNVDLSKDV